MAPPCWMTPAQRAVVLPLFADYSHYQATKKLHKFWPLVYEAWFYAFPEEAQLGVGVDKANATVEQLDALQRATEKRKRQLQSWFRNQRARAARVAGHATTLSKKTLTSAFFTGKPKRSRIHKPIEVFQQLNSDEIRAEITRQENERTESDCQEAVPEAQASGSKELQRARFMLRRDIANKLYAAASEEELAEVAAVIETERASKEAKKEENKNTVEVDREHSPEEYQIAIDESVDTVNKFLRLMYEKTGWFAFITWGGPNPRLGGRLSVKSDCIGQTPSGNDFIAQHAQYQEGICMPFAQFLQRSFGPSGLACRALPGTLPSNDGDGDVVMAPVLPVAGDEADTDSGLAPRDPAMLSARQPQAFFEKRKGNRTKKLAGKKKRASGTLPADSVSSSFASTPTQTASQDSHAALFSTPAPIASQDLPAALSPPASPPGPLSPLPPLLHLPSEDEDDPQPNINLDDSLVLRMSSAMPWDMDWFPDAASFQNNGDSLPDDRRTPNNDIFGDSMQNANSMQAITPIQTGLGIMYSWPSSADISVSPATTGVAPDAADASSPADVQTIQLPPRPRPRPRYRNTPVQPMRSQLFGTPSPPRVTSPALPPVSSPLAVTQPAASAFSSVTPRLPPLAAPSPAAQTPPPPGPFSDPSLAILPVSFPRSRQAVNPPKTATNARAGKVAATLVKKNALEAARAAKAQQKLKKSEAAQRAAETRAVRALPDPITKPVDPTLASVTSGTAYPVSGTTNPAVNPTAAGLVLRNGDDTNRKELKRVRARKALQDKVSFNPDGMHPLVIFTRRNLQRERKAPAPADAQYMPKTKMLTLAEQRAARDAPLEEALLKRASANRRTAESQEAGKGGAAKTRSAKMTRACR